MIQIQLYILFLILVIVAPIVLNKYGREIYHKFSILSWILISAVLAIPFSFLDMFFVNLAVLAIPIGACLFSIVFLQKYNLVLPVTAAIAYSVSILVVWLLGPVLQTFAFYITNFLSVITGNL